ncbi:hypothetical protein PQX77_019137 [Marasmius sp. AFHP31]|nr:hypothetical protein PQX77_019137 [Marasmius sp. AFHP31]
MIVNPKIKLEWLARQQIDFPSPGRDYIKEAMEPFFKELEKIPLPSTTSTGSTSTGMNSTQQQFDDDFDGDWTALTLKDKTTQSQNQVSTCDKGKSYLTDTYIDTEMDSLTFWQWNSQQWPRVFRLALNILPVQGSSVPSERVFCSAKLTKTDLRNQLSPHMMEACMILKGSYQLDGPIDFTSHFRHDPMVEELQLMTQKDNEMPLEEDVSIVDYVASFQPLPTGTVEEST